jgi:hypothetical protein
LHCQPLEVSQFEPGLKMMCLHCQPLEVSQFEPGLKMMCFERQVAEEVF